MYIIAFIILKSQFVNSLIDLSSLTFSNKDTLSLDILQSNNGKNT